MRVCLATADSHIVATIRSVVPDAIVQTDPSAGVMSADFYIWDCDLQTDIPQTILDRQEEGQVLLLVSPNRLSPFDLDLLEEHYTLLKPVHSLTIQTILGLAAKAWQLNQKASHAAELRSDRDALAEYLLATNLHLQEYGRQRTNFLARALHDLRAPLTALHGYCGLLAEGQIGSVSSTQRELFVRMQTSTRRLSRQAARMFELTVADQARRQPQRRVAEIDDVVAQAADEASQLAQDKEQSVSIDLAIPEMPLLFDSEQMNQVFFHLLENCCKFTPVRGSIEIRGYNVQCDFQNGTSNPKICCQDQLPSNGYRIDIEDNGAAIPSQVLPSVFEHFASYSAGRDRSGGGLGLAISKMIVSAHQGYLWAENSHGGVVFSIVLPFQPLPQLFSDSFPDGLPAEALNFSVQ